MDRSINRYNIIFWGRSQAPNDKYINHRPYVTLAMPFNFILSIYPVFLMAMPVNMILVMYVILCILSYDFNKLTMLYIHVHISISMTNKSGLTFFLSIKYLSVCLSSKLATSMDFSSSHGIFERFDCYMYI